MKVWAKLKDTWHIQLFDQPCILKLYGELCPKGVPSISFLLLFLPPMICSLFLLKKKTDFLKYSYIFFSLLSAPTAPPANILVYVVSRDTIFITWDEVPEEARHGIVRRYEVNVKHGDQVVQIKTVDAPSGQYEISNLAVDTLYCVQVLAHTVQNGPLSVCVNVTWKRGTKNKKPFRFTTGRCL